MSAMGDIADEYKELHNSLPTLRQRMHAAEAEMVKLLKTGEYLPEWFRFLVGAIQSTDYNARALMTGVTYAMHTEHDNIMHFHYDCGISECQNPYCKQSSSPLCGSCDDELADGHTCLWSNHLQRTVRLSADEMAAAKAHPEVISGQRSHVWVALKVVEDAHDAAVAAERTARDS